MMGKCPIFEPKEVMRIHDSLGAALIVALSAHLSGAAIHEFIVGSISSRFLYTGAFDDENLTLSLVANITTPTINSWIALSPDKKTLYGTDYAYMGATNESDVVPTFPSFSIDNSSSIVFDKSLTLPGCNGSSIWVGADPLPPHNVFGADFWTIPGCGTTMSVTETGELDRVLQTFHYYPNSSIHGSAFSPDGRYFYSADTQGNALFTHRIDRPPGTLGELVNVLPGPWEDANPRHVAVHPGGKRVYAVMEHAALVVSYTPDLWTGALSQDSALYSLLPARADVEDYWADEIAVSPSGRYLWATNRGKGGRKGLISAFDLDLESGEILGQNFLLETSTSGGVANAVAVMDAAGVDRFVALTDNEVGFVEMWELVGNGMSAEAVARLDLADVAENERYGSGCCANIVWLS